MADIVQADYESLAAVAKRFAQQSNKIRQMHDRLNRQVTLLRPTWVGKGSEAFFAEIGDKVLPAVQRLSAALAEADRVTRQIEEILHSAEEQGSSPFQRDEEPVLRGQPYEPGTGVGESGGGGDAGDENSGGAGDEIGSGTGDDGDGAGGAGDEAGGGAGGYGDGVGGAGDEIGSGTGDDGDGAGGAGDEAGGGAGGYGDGVGGAGSPDDGPGNSGGNLGEDFVRDLDDFGQEYSIDNLGSGSGGAWDDDSFRPSDMDNAALDQLYTDHGFDATGDFGAGEAGSLGPGGDSSFDLPDDWLADVDQDFGSPRNDDLGQDLAGADGSGSSGSDAGSASGGGGESSGSDSGSGESSGSDGGGSTGSGGAPTGTASPASEMGQTSPGGMPLGQGNGLGMSGQAAAEAAAEAVPVPLRYTAIGGGGAGMKAAVMDAKQPGAAALGTAAAAPQAAQANVGVPMGIAALAPLLALVGKAVKDRSSSR